MSDSYEESGCVIKKGRKNDGKTQNENKVTKNRQHEQQLTFSSNLQHGMNDPGEVIPFSNILIDKGKKEYWLWSDLNGVRRNK